MAVGQEVCRKKNSASFIYNLWGLSGKNELRRNALHVEEGTTSTFLDASSLHALSSHTTLLIQPSKLVDIGNNVTVVRCLFYCDNSVSHWCKEGKGQVDEEWSTLTPDWSTIELMSHVHASSVNIRILLYQKINQLWIIIERLWQKMWLPLLCIVKVPQHGHQWIINPAINTPANIGLKREDRELIPECEVTIQFISDGFHSTSNMQTWLARPMLNNEPFLSTKHKSQGILLLLCLGAPAQPAVTKHP